MHQVHALISSGNVLCAQCSHSLADEDLRGNECDHDHEGDEAPGADQRDQQDDDCQCFKRS